MLLPGGRYIVQRSLGDALRIRKSYGASDKLHMMTRDD